MPETPDFTAIAEALRHNQSMGVGDAFDDVAADVRAIAEQLRLVCYARGAADVAQLDAAWPRCRPSPKRART